MSATHAPHCVRRSAGKRITQLSLILILLLASFAAASPAQAWSCGSSYVIQRGDWLAKIANACGVSLADLRAANPWTYYERYIFPGQVLTIPGGYDDGYNQGGPVGYCGPSYDVYGSYWVVCRGDTLGSIGRYYGVSWTYLQWHNALPNANLIYAGQIIRP
jgi:LysM repeat protein